jgi:hypothetical protein
MSTIITKKIATNKLVYSYKAYVDLTQDEKQLKHNVRVDVAFDEDSIFYFIDRVDEKYINVESENGTIITLLNDQIKTHLPLEFRKEPIEHKLEVVDNTKIVIPEQIIERKSDDVTIVKTHLRKKNKKKKD